MDIWICLYIWRQFYGFISTKIFFTDKDNNYGWLFSTFSFSLHFQLLPLRSFGLFGRKNNFSLYNVLYVKYLHLLCPRSLGMEQNGWLYNLGVVDFAGCGPVHMVGGSTGLVGTYMLGPRKF